MDAKVLVVEDDSDIRDVIKIILEDDGCEVIGASNGIEGLELADDSIDLVILDVAMPGMDGFEVCEKLRKTSNVPVLFLTARSKEHDRLNGLVSGGDDYMTKPFSASELQMRVQALVRRYHLYKGKEEGSDTLKYMERHGVRISRMTNDVTLNGTTVKLSDIEYGILNLLMSKPGKVFSAEEIYSAVWDEPYYYSSNSTVMVHIRKLRVKLEEDPKDPARIKTVWGKGYRFD